jgi:hypothetical protein
VKTYRCKHAVEAQRWTDTDENREAFATWFEKHDALFETRGPIALLPDLQTRSDGDHNRVEPGEWILYSDGEFIVMEDDLFTRDYEEAP